MRPNILGLGPLAALWMVWVAWGRRALPRIPLSWTALLLSTVVMVVPITVRNYVASGEFVPIATYFGENLLIGNDKDSDGVTPWLPYLQELEGTGNWSARDYVNVVRGVGKELGKPDITHSEVSDYFAKKAKDFIRANPGLTLRRVLERAAQLWAPREITCNKVVHYELRHYPALRMLPGFALAAALFWFGSVMLVLDALRGRLPKAAPDGARTGQMAAMILVFIAVYLGSFLLFFVNGRARVPVIPLLFLVGGYGVARLAGLFRAGRPARAGLGAAFLLLLFGLFSVQWIPYTPDLGRWHYQRADSYLRTGHLDRAIGEGRAVIASNEGAAYMHQRLGKAFADAGKTDEAVEQFEAALRKDPGFQDVLYRLGAVLEKKGGH